MNLPELKLQLASIAARSKVGTGGQVSPEDFRAAFQFCFDNYESMDAEAQAHVNKMMEDTVQHIRKAAEESPDSSDKQKILRAIETFEGRRFRADALFQRLQEPPRLDMRVLPDTKSAVLRLAQPVLDLLHEVTKHTFRGPARFAILGLSYWAVEELLVALYLAQRAMTNQTYTHIRTIYEMLNKIELFHLHPQWVALWASGDEKKKWKELSPKAVRAKLGKPKFDPVYSFLSRYGPHGEFEGVQMRAGKMIGPFEDKTTRVKFWLGGNKFPDDIMWANISCVFAAINLLSSTMIVFEKYANPQEDEELRQEADKIAGEYFGTHFRAYLEKHGVPADKIDEFLRTAPWQPPQK